MNMQLIRGSLVSALGMWLSSIAIFFALGTNNDLQEALAIGVAIVSPFVILGFLVAWAIPVHLLLKRRNHTRIVWYALIGIMLARTLCTPHLLRMPSALLRSRHSAQSAA